MLLLKAKPNYTYFRYAYLTDTFQYYGRSQREPPHSLVKRIATTAKSHVTLWDSTYRVEELETAYLRVEGPTALDVDTSFSFA
ncbi:MAG: hypothetical protein COB66_04515 [Coxiella sp. (in: Bacteria)]|nr:MAG: hypothetical protein COB66_04515 [Coxiella sp. (in: g-proteobacteria)]